VANAPEHTHADPAVAGFDVSSALTDLNGMIDHLATIPELLEFETQAIEQQARAMAPVATGRYRTAFRWKVFHNDDGSTRGSVFVIQLPWVRNLKWQKRTNPSGSKLWPKNLPLWLEYGTRLARGVPHLIPAFEAGKQRLNRAVEAVVARLAS
jgi:hypothetical protein